jgi:hypothetical protein
MKILNFQRNPYPGCIASAFVISAAAIFDIFGQVSLAVLCKTFSKLTCKLSASAVE